ncbi:MAG: CPBP family intramembrane glutamic endopeptidase [Acidobacteriota bacterium]
MGNALALYLVLVLGVVPFAAWRAASQGLILNMPRSLLYRSALRTSWFLALLGTAALWWDQRLTPQEIGLTARAPRALLIAGVTTLALLLAGLLAFFAVRRLLGGTESPQLLHLIPRSRDERLLFSALALSAGITEELVFHGIAITALTRISILSGPHRPWVAALLVSLPFGLGHGYQQLAGVIRAGLLGFGLAVPFLLTGSLLPGMFAHALIDLTLLTAPWRRLARP